MVEGGLLWHCTNCWGKQSSCFRPDECVAHNLAQNFVVITALVVNDVHALMRNICMRSYFFLFWTFFPAIVLESCPFFQVLKRNCTIFFIPILSFFFFFFCMYSSDSPRYFFKSLKAKLHLIFSYYKFLLKKQLRYSLQQHLKGNQDLNYDIVYSS